MITKTNLIFLEMILITILALLVDATKFILITSKLEHSPIAIEYISKLDMALFIFINYELVRYIGSYVFKVKPVIRTAFNVLITVGLIAVFVLVLLLPIKILNQGEFNSYISGPAVYLMHGAIVFFILIAYTFTLMKENVATKKRKRVIRRYKKLSSNK